MNMAGAHAEVLRELTELKSDLFVDIREALVFKPNRTQDLYSFMRDYLQESSRDNREDVKEGILRNLINCAEGREYPDPRTGHMPYTPADVQQLEAAVDRYISAAQEGDADIMVDAEMVFNESVKALDEATDNGIIDTWRREQLYHIQNACHELMTVSMVMKGNDAAGQHQASPTMEEL